MKKFMRWLFTCMMIWLAEFVLYRVNVEMWSWLWWLSVFSAGFIAVCISAVFEIAVEEYRKQKP